MIEIEERERIKQPLDIRCTSVFSFQIQPSESKVQSKLWWTSVSPVWMVAFWGHSSIYPSPGQIVQSIRLWDPPFFWFSTLTLTYYNDKEMHHVFLFHSISTHVNKGIPFARCSANKTPELFAIAVEIYNSYKLLLSHIQTRAESWICNCLHFLFVNITLSFFPFLTSAFISLKLLV